MNLVSLLLYRAGNPNGDQVFTVGQESRKARAVAVSAAPALGSDAAHTPTPHPDTPREHGQLLMDSNYVTISPTGRKVQQTENYVKWLN